MQTIARSTLFDTSPHLFFHLKHSPQNSSLLLKSIAKPPMSKWQSEQKELLMNIEANKAIVRKYIELWSTGNLALADEVLAVDFVDHTHPNRIPGPESVKQEVKAFRDDFPDARITIEQMIGESDIVAFRFVPRGTHLGTFAGFPPTSMARLAEVNKSMHCFYRIWCILIVRF